MSANCLVCDNGNRLPNGWKCDVCGRNTHDSVRRVVSRRFPLMRYEPWREMPEQLEWIPWDLLAPHDEQARRNHGGQNLEKLASRGGLSACEAVAIIEDTDYCKMWPFPIHSREEGKDRCIKANNRLREILTAAGATANDQAHPTAAEREVERKEKEQA